MGRRGDGAGEYEGGCGWNHLMWGHSYSHPHKGCLGNDDEGSDDDGEEGASDSNNGGDDSDEGIDHGDDDGDEGDGGGDDD